MHICQQDSLASDTHGGDTGDSDNSHNISCDKQSSAVLGPRSAESSPGPHRPHDIVSASMPHCCETGDWREKGGGRRHIVT